MFGAWNRRIVDMMKKTKDDTQGSETTEQDEKVLAKNAQAMDKKFTELKEEIEALKDSLKDAEDKIPAPTLKVSKGNLYIKDTKLNYWYKLDTAKLVKEDPDIEDFTEEEKAVSPHKGALAAANILRGI